VTERSIISASGVRVWGVSNARGVVRLSGCSPSLHPSTALDAAAVLTYLPVPATLRTRLVRQASGT
jgi:hypothetical protein